MNTAVADNTPQPNSITLEASLHAALGNIDTPVCADAASMLLARQVSDTSDITLHLRSAGITADGAALIANALTDVSEIQRRRLRSFSLSYNDIGDDGATSLAAALPSSLTALGLVGCSITDTGANALLQWAANAPGLKMICVESNSVSNTTRDSFAQLGRKSPGLSVYI